MMNDKRKENYVRGQLRDIVEPVQNMPGKCRCGTEGQKDHACPLNEEIYGDHETLCNCCNNCTTQCSLDI